jgi:hypothetical protein
MSQVILRLSLDSNAIGPFSLYTGSTETTPIETEITRDQLVAGIVVDLPAASTGTTYLLIFQNNEPGCDNNIVQKQVTIYGPEVSPSPTPSVTPTLTPTPSLSATPGGSPSPTPTHTPTPSLSAIPGGSPSPTPTHTPTPTQTPPNLEYAYLFIEPQINSGDIGSYMYSNYPATNFFGFSNLSSPDFESESQFEEDMNLYIDYVGWTNSTMPAIRTQYVPQTTGGVDSFGNLIIEFNFTTHEVPAGTVEGSAWYTWIIPTSATNGGIQTIIDLGTNGTPNTLTQIFTDYSLYQYEFSYTGTNIPSGNYRVYSSFVDPAFYINNSQNIYFKGGGVT